MKHTILETEQVEKIEAITCDACKVKYDDPMELQEFLCYEDRGGYSSVFGDMYLIQIDLCQHCVKELLGKYVRVLKDRVYY